MTIAQAARKFGIKDSRLRIRVGRGIPAEVAVSEEAYLEYMSSGGASHAA
jgi:hypothetical protein